VWGARLHFDEAEHRPLPGNQIQITGLIARRPATRDNGIPLAPQIEEGRVLAGKASGQMRRQSRRAPAPLCNAIQCTQGALQQRHPTPRDSSHRDLFCARTASVQTAHVTAIRDATGGSLWLGAVSDNGYGGLADVFVLGECQRFLQDVERYHCFFLGHDERRTEAD
jgi:hypothetical protein